MEDKYVAEHPVLSFRVTMKERDIVDDLVRHRGEWTSKFSRQTYLYELLQKDLKEVGLI